MDKNYEQLYHSLEDSYWWFIGRRELILDLISKNNKKSKILDIGCSTGKMITMMKEEGFTNLYGIDISKKAIDQCKKQGIPNTSVMDASKLKFKKEMFDILIASDVLEHISDDEKALKNWKEILSNKGEIIIFVPAFQSLWSDHDVANNHYRRYNANSLREVLEKSGFKIKKLSYWNISPFIPLFIFRAIARYISKGKKSSSLFVLPNFVNKVFTSILRVENLLLKKMNFPFGVSVFAVAVKKP